MEFYDILLIPAQGVCCNRMGDVERDNGSEANGVTTRLPQDHVQRPMHRYQVIKRVCVGRPNVDFEKAEFVKTK